MQQWLAQAPTNIALIKYMGKKESQTNLPINASLSFTLDQLKSTVTLEAYPGKKDFWEPLEIPGAQITTLPLAAQERFLAHLQFLKDQFAYEGAFIVRSSSNFPMSTGLASSASSFAALTRCAVLALVEQTKSPEPSVQTQAMWSRCGSGSSCRSFFSPWALWEGDTVKAIHLPYDQLIHEVILVSHEAKSISSSRAHELVKTSPLYASRPQQAQEHLDRLLAAFRLQDWAEARAICWKEFHDMHALFSSCDQPFSYMTSKTHELLHQLETRWQRIGDGPIVTMDAGPNIHLLYRPDQVDLAWQFKQEVLIGNFDVI